MKKYVKPELFYERYELSQHIADCAWEMDHNDNNSCVAIGGKDSGYEGFTLVTPGVCEVMPDAYEEYCYQNSTNGSANLHNS